MTPSYLLILGAVIGCSTSEPSSEQPSDGGASNGGSSGADGGSGPGGLGGSGAGATGGGGMAGANGTECVLIVGDRTCDEGCCGLLGFSYEMPEDLSCKRLTSPDEQSFIDCYADPGLGCGGGLATAICLQRETSGGFDVWYVPTQPFGWSPSEGWERCSADVADAQLNAPDCSE
jgi:hypothetical protein